MDTVRSNDGTLIAYERSGNGPPLVLVHGSTADHSRWAQLLPDLTRHFSVFAMDRRGRGKSGDSEDYTLEAEFDDVAAVVDAAGPGASLLGHSFGALCAMEAALRASDLRKLILYEPAFQAAGVEMYEPGAREKLQAILDQGDRELLLTSFFRDVVRMPPHEIATLRSDATWPARLAAAHTAVREMADGDYVLEPDRFRKLTVPTLLLEGGNSPLFLKAATEQLASVLPNSRIVVMPGQGHAAMNTAPELFLREVISFLPA